MGFRLTHSHKAGMASGTRSAELAARTPRDKADTATARPNNNHPTKYGGQHIKVRIVPRCHWRGSYVLSKLCTVSKYVSMPVRVCVSRLQEAVAMYGRERELISKG